MYLWCSRLSDSFASIWWQVRIPGVYVLQLISARRIVTVDTVDMNTRMDVEAILTDWIHAAAFRSNTLGLPKICADGDADKITRDHLLAFMSRHFVPERMVVVGW